MKDFKLHIIDDFLDEPEEYIDAIHDMPFDNYDTDSGTFSNIQLRGMDIVVERILQMYPDYALNLNIIRQSPYGQLEPNFIHSDKIMGDLTCVLYLNSSFPMPAGTRLYVPNDKDSDHEFEASVDLYMGYNRLVIFPAELHHSRMRQDNFGADRDSRLIQVIFLKKI